MEAGTMFQYLQDNDRRVAVEGAYQAVRRLFESLGGPRGAAPAAKRESPGQVRSARAFDSSGELAERIFEDIEQAEHRPLGELDSERIGYYTNLLTSRVEERFPKSAGSSSRASDVLSEMRRAI